MEPGGESDAIQAIVIELLPQAGYRLELESRHQVIAHAAPPSSANFVRCRVNDKVLVRLSPHDAGRGRIVKLLRG